MPTIFGRQGEASGLNHLYIDVKKFKLVEISDR